MKLDHRTDQTLCHSELRRSLCVGLVCLGGLAMTLGVFWSCAAPAFGPGVTTGGAQDIAYARRSIEDGSIPSPDAITVEGFLSEHTIPAPPPPDAGIVYATTAVAWNKDFDAFTPLVTIMLGFGTTIDAESFEREPLNLGIVLDRSGSMNDVIEERSGATKWDAVLIAVDRLLAKLDADDRVSVITFASRSNVAIEGAAGNDLAAIKSSFDDILPEGSTDLVGGMASGYRAVSRTSAEGRMNRIIVLTDAQPYGFTAHESEEFLEVMSYYADRDIGTTLFGVGSDFGQELAYDISQVRGGNYFFLSDYDRIVSVFDEDFDFLVTPVAYDVTLTASIAFEYDVVDLFGVPVSDEPLTHTMEVTIPTLFLSSREGGGAVLLRLRPGALVDFAQGGDVADMTLTYSTPSGEEQVDHLSVALPGGLDPEAATAYFESDGAKRAVLLLNTALVLRNACEDMTSDGAYYWYYYSWEDQQRAIDRLTEFLPYFDALAEGLEDRLAPNSRSLSEERALVEQLLSNIESW
jgi:Ca-activated chloride channel family protein